MPGIVLSSRHKGEPFRLVPALQELPIWLRRLSDQVDGWLEGSGHWEWTLPCGTVINSLKEGVVGRGCRMDMWGLKSPVDADIPVGPSP